MRVAPADGERTRGVSSADEFSCLPDELVRVPLAIEKPIGGESERINLSVLPLPRCRCMPAVAQDVNQGSLPAKFAETLTRFLYSARVVPRKTMVEPQLGRQFVEPQVYVLAARDQQPQAILTMHIEMRHQEPSFIMRIQR